jgi:hypothetical protein
MLRNFYVKISLALFSSFLLMASRVKRPLMCFFCQVLMQNASEVPSLPLKIYHSQIVICWKGPTKYGAQVLQLLYKSTLYLEAHLGVASAVLCPIILSGIFSELTVHVLKWNSEAWTCIVPCLRIFVIHGIKMRLLDNPLLVKCARNAVSLSQVWLKVSERISTPCRKSCDFWQKSLHSLRLSVSRAWDARVLPGPGRACSSSAYGSIKMNEGKSLHYASVCCADCCGTCVIEFDTTFIHIM